MKPHSRRTHGAYRSEEEAHAAAKNMAFLLNGMPMGWNMYIGQRLGAFVLFSQRIER